VLAEKLACLEVWWLGVFIAPTTKVVVGEAVCRRAHRTVRCASHVTQPLGLDRLSSDKWGHRTVTVHCPVRLLAPAVTLRALFTHCSLLQTTIGAVIRCSAWHTGQSGATPDNPVNYSGVAFLKRKCALKPFLSILVIECQHKYFCVDLCNMVDKVQIMSKGMFLRLSTLFQRLMYCV
jgi:hypothetical protein